MRNVLGVVNLHDCPHLGPLTMKRPTGATTFLGRYGLMDFTLSNFSNSGIDRVAVLAESNYRSVRNHLQDGRIWVNNTKLGFQRILTNESLLSVSKFNTDIANLMANKNVFYENDPKYIIVAPVFYVNYQRQVEFSPPHGFKEVLCLIEAIGVLAEEVIGSNFQPIGLGAVVVMGKLRVEMVDTLARLDDYKAVAIVFYLIEVYVPVVARHVDA